MLPTLKTALVHDWLVTYRGGERVLEALCRLFPQAPIYTLFHQKGSQPLSIEQHPIIESPLAKIPGARARHRWFLPLYPFAIEQFDLQGYDLVISTSHAVAKGVITRADALHVSYVHTPMRYVWEQEAQYKSGLGPGARLLFSAIAPLLRMWDESSEKRVDCLVANSKTVQRRIAKRYRRDAEVVYPPVDVERFAPQVASERTYYLAVSALVPYKRIDLVVEAFSSNGKQLVVVGDGPDRAMLERRAGANVQFVGQRPLAELVRYYQGARALIFPGEEDFGITPVEAMAAGTPVIAFGRGGATETVVPLNHPRGDGRAPTGVWFMEPTVRALEDAIGLFEQNAEKFHSAAIIGTAQQYRRERFTTEMQTLIERQCAAHFGHDDGDGKAAERAALHRVKAMP